ncbi:MAG: hypothetical protein K2L04_06310 [Alistipes sp.]|nr:hypothetical protein [Alistipes sp.]
MILRIFWVVRVANVGKKSPPQKILQTKYNVGLYIADSQPCALFAEKAVLGGFVKRGQRPDGGGVCSRCVKKITAGAADSQ